MFTQIARAPESATAPARPRAALLESRLSNFRAEVQPRVRALAAEHNWIADLAISFPAVLFALAFPRQRGASEEATRLVINGAPLAAVAQNAGVPLWLRNFPPEAFETPLLALPDSPDFRRRIANHLPKSWRAAPTWLDHVAKATETADEEIALWFARETPLKEKRTKTYKQRVQNQHRRLVALWAWHTRHADPALMPNPTPWRSEMQWKAAITAALDWRDALLLPLYLGDGHLADTWLEDGTVDGYSFAALRSQTDVRAEADAMKHCVARYGADLADNYVRLWSVRRDGERVATLSLEALNGPLPQIRELSGPMNAAVPIEMWIATRRWLMSQDKPDLDVTRFQTKIAQADPRVWRRMWRPYWVAKGRIPSWLPLKPDTTSLYLL
ncbi:MAG: hypothetical protein R3C30_01975 [Hyphomonadaceae bacterium]